MKYVWKLNQDWCVLVDKTLYVHADSGLWDRDARLTKRDEYDKLGYTLVKCHVSALRGALDPLTYEEFMAALLRGD